MNDKLVQYAIYEKPVDYPDSFVVRQWEISAGEVSPGPAQLADSLEGARALIPAGAQLLPDFEGDDPKIVEVWAAS